MARDVIDQKILEKIISNPKIKSMKIQSIRNAISEIHAENHGITMNAAAYIFAKRKRFKIYKYLKPNDKESLKFLKPAITETTETKTSKKIRRIKKLKFDFETPFHKEAYENANCYQHLYILENTLRRVIFDTLGNDRSWWNDKFVDSDIQKIAKETEDRTKKYKWLKLNIRGNHPLFYIGLYDLFKIINKNWPKFKSTFNNDLEHLRFYVKESVPIRHLVAHHIKTREIDRKKVEINTNYICTLIENSKKQ